MKVAWNCRLLNTPNLRGFGRYILQTLAHLPKHGIRPLLYSIEPIPTENLSQLPAGSFDVFIGGRRQPLLWDQFHWGQHARGQGAAVLHSPCNFGLPVRCRLPKVLTLHDAIDYTFYLNVLPFRQRWTKGAMIMRWMHASSRYAADRVLTVSQHAKQDLIGTFGFARDRITVTYGAADPSFAPAAAAEVARVRQQHQLPNRYVFYVGGWERRKNVPFLVRAFAVANLTGVDLVLAGGRSDHWAELSRLREELQIGDRLKLIGRVEDRDLAPLYTGAMAFVNPSEYEGFGLQLCEAMNCHTPTLASRSSCLPEVLGTGGATFSLESIDELSALLRRIAEDEPYRQNLIAAATARAPAFSWDRCAAETAEVYRELAKARAS